jgi:hypothetical protein
VPVGRLHAVPVGPLVGLLVGLVGPEGVVSPVGVLPWGIRKMSGMLHPERHVCVVWGNKTPSRKVLLLPVMVSHFQTGKKHEE